MTAQIIFPAFSSTRAFFFSLRDGRAQKIKTAQSPQSARMMALLSTLACYLDRRGGGGGGFIEKVEIIRKGSVKGIN